MNRTRTMILLFLLLCGALAYSWVATPKQKRVVAGRVEMKPIKQKSSSQNLVASGIEALDFSQGIKKEFTQVNKNLFAPLYTAPKPVKSYSVPAKIIKTKPLPPAKKAEPVVVMARGPEPIQPLNVLGFLNKKGEYTVFLATAKGKVYVVKQGDNFSKDLNVAKITSQEITVARNSTAQQVTLKMDKVKSQRLPTVSINSGRPKFVAPVKVSNESNKNNENKVIKPIPAENPFTNAIRKMGN